MRHTLKQQAEREGMVHQFIAPPCNKITSQEALFVRGICLVDLDLISRIYNLKQPTMDLISNREAAGGGKSAESHLFLSLL